MSLNELGEFGLIEKISSQFPTPDNITGIGDDCAIIPQRDGMQTLVSTDMLVEGSHFILNDVRARDLGWKSAAVNFSDIAACGGKPTGSFLSIALPDSLDEKWVEEFIDGYREMSLSVGAHLLGGDTTSSPDRLCINVTVTGEIPDGKAKLRSHAKPGDLICVTGTLGDSACGLKLILEGLPRIPFLIERHYRPTPRVKEAQRLALNKDIHAMMDISDGIASDIRHILKASHVGAIIDTSKLPLSAEMKEACAIHDWDPVELALCGGEDYELLFTMSPSCKPSVPCTVIGNVTSSSDLIWEPETDKNYLGFRHF